MKITLLQIILFMVGLLLIIILYNIYKSIKKSNHFNDFTVNSNVKEKSLFGTLEVHIWKMIGKLSQGLGKYKIIKKLAKRYSKYILYVERSYKKEIDYFTIKILLIIILLLLNIMGMLLYIVPANIISIIITILIGYFIPDFIWQYKFQLRLNKVNKELFNVVKYMNFALNKDVSIIEALDYTIANLENPIKDELEKVRSDLKYGLSINEAFKRFYKRSRLCDLQIIVDTLDLAIKCNIDMKDAFNTLNNYEEKELRRKEKFNTITSFYNYLFVLSLVIPLFVYVLGLSVSLEYFMPLFNSYKGYLVLVGMLVTYIIYIYVVKAMLEVNDD